MATHPQGKSNTERTMKLTFLLVIASSALDGHIKLWEIESGKLIRTIDGGPSKPLPIKQVIDN